MNDFQFAVLSVLVSALIAAVMGIHGAIDRLTDTVKKEKGIQLTGTTERPHSAFWHSWSLCSRCCSSYGL